MASIICWNDDSQFRKDAGIPLTFLCDKCCNGVNFECQYDDITLYSKLLVLLYAIDTVVFGTDEKAFQNNLDTFFEYSDL